MTTKFDRIQHSRAWLGLAWSASIATLLIGLMLTYLGCHPSYSLDNYMAQVAGAEKRAEAFKEDGKWTPNALRAYAKQLRSGEVIAQGALAEAGVVILQDINVSTVRTALEAVAQRVEDCGGADTVPRVDGGADVPGATREMVQLPYKAH